MQPMLRRALMDEVDWKARLIGIKGSRGVGKTAFLLQYARENFGSKDRRCLYINMNNFYFQGKTLFEFACEFQRAGGQVLLIDQVFKDPDWSHELRSIHDRCPRLRVVFTGSSVMRSREILAQVNPLDYFPAYLHHGYYPFFLEKSNFSENLLKVMNMMIEVDILLIKQIELKYLNRIKKLLYLVASAGTGAPNVTQLASETQTSRATVMNYIKYLSDARLINMVYRQNEEFPKKPSELLMHNTNLMYAMMPDQVDKQVMMETFFQNALWGRHEICMGDRSSSFIIDKTQRFRICLESPRRKNTDIIYALSDITEGEGQEVPLWMYGFLY